MKNRSKKFILWFNEISNKDVGLVGGKNASLGEMYQKLTKKGIRIPNGFATTSFAYWEFLEKSKIENRKSKLPARLAMRSIAGRQSKIQNLKEAIAEVLKGLDAHNIQNLKTRGKKIREMIMASKFPKELEREIIEAYHKLSQEYGRRHSRMSPATDLDVAVRSSATAEDLPNASFAGQQESYLNIRGEKALLLAVKKCIVSLFTDRAISYREDMGFDHLKIALSVGIMKMVRSDKASSGVMFSCDTESGFRDVTLINASYGLGENIVKGKVTPDQFYVFKPTLKKGFKPIIGKQLGTKEYKLVYADGRRHSRMSPARYQGRQRDIMSPAVVDMSSTTKNVPVSKNEQRKFSLKDKEILQLAKWSCLIEDHYRRSMDIEWAKDGIDGKLYILQARPETIQSRKDVDVIEEYVLEKLKANKAESQKPRVIISGLSVGNKIGQGKVKVILNVKDIEKFKKGEVLVTKMTDPDWEPVMKIASAIVTDEGGRTCHSAIVSRELGIPCIVGANKATQILKNGQKITVSCAEGEVGKVYQGLIPFKVRKINIASFKRPKTKIMMNLGEPDQAFSLRFIPNDGVGLAREEFIINNYIKIHPLALVNFSRLKDKRVKSEIKKLTFAWKDKKRFYIDKLAEGIGKIAAAFYPRDVIVRFSDFKTNEYANLIGGKEFEPKEDNPMLGWRGASRYYNEKFKKAFILECQAVKKVRDEFGLDNVIVMIPFCRTLDEARQVLKIIKESGLKRKASGIGQCRLRNLKIYMMAEIPSNIILAKDFAKIFDGFSIGSNDLTQLTLGLDRDSKIVSYIFDERNEAVKKLIKYLIKVAHQHKRKVSICGQAPSDFPEFAEFLVRSGIDSISLNPDTVLKTTLMIVETEKKLKK